MKNTNYNKEIKSYDGILLYYQVNFYKIKIMKKKTLKNAENNKRYQHVIANIDVHDTMNPCIKFEEILMRTS